MNNEQLEWDTSSNWEQPCFTVNGLSIFAAGSYGSWIYVPMAFCIYRLWLLCSLIIECHLIKNTKPMQAQICLHIKVKKSLKTIALHKSRILNTLNPSKLFLNTKNIEI